MTLTGFFTFGVSPRGTKSTVAPSSEDARTCFAANLKKWIFFTDANNYETNVLPPLIVPPTQGSSDTMYPHYPQGKKGVL